MLQTSQLKWSARLGVCVFSWAVAAELDLMLRLAF